jgi:outer membrane protein assembly factor BamB
LMGFARENGKQLWRVALETNAKRHAATPVISGDNVIVNSHTIGLVCFKISKQDNQFNATKLWANKDLTINLSTPVFVGGFLYSQGPQKDFVCADAKTGELKWTQPGFGKENSSVIAIENKLLVLTDSGELVSISATPKKYSELGRIQVCGKNWNFPAFADGKLYVRDSRELACFDLRQN